MSTKTHSRFFWEDGGKASHAGVVSLSYVTEDAEPLTALSCLSFAESVWFPD